MTALISLLATRKVLLGMTSPPLAATIARIAETTTTAMAISEVQGLTPTKPRLRQAQLPQTQASIRL